MVANSGIVKKINKLMPRLSLYRSVKSNDYRFLDKRIHEMYTIGATDLYIHKYIGSNNPINSTDLTQPHYLDTTVTNIQDLLFLENRDRKYDPNIYRLRGHYSFQNLDFDLSQFGLFLSNDIIYVTVHYNDMIDVIGRKLMVGDVFELPHLTDYHPLNETIPIGLRRYYQITDANFASEGFSVTWYPHMWRIKCEPLVDSQEFANILQQPINKDNYLGDWDPTKTYEPGYTVTYGDKIYTPTQSVPAGTLPTDPNYWTVSSEQNLQDIIARYKKNLEINDAALAEAALLVPKSGYDRSQLYVVPTLDDGQPGLPTDVIVPSTTTGNTIGTVNTIANSQYKLPSTVLRVSRENKDLIKSLNLKAGLSILLEMSETTPTLTEGGSGALTGDPIILGTILGMAVTGPYGTADNTYATSDQFIEFKLTALNTAPRSTTIFLLNAPTDLVPQLLVRATVYSENGTPTYIFPEGTRVVSVDYTNNLMIVDNPINGYLPSGTSLEFSYDFTGQITQSMDYRADCDPRFQFIRRNTPRSFGYLAGYLMGNEDAPNGEPVGTGTVFPANPMLGDYFLRLDYLPQKLFRFNGKVWVEISRNVRTPPTLTNIDQSQISTFINNNATVPTAQGGTIPSRQSLSQALKITPD